MSIKIEVRKHTDIDGKQLVTLNISGMKRKYDLPQEYLDGCPMIYIDHSYVSKPVFYRDVGREEYDQSEQPTDKPLTPETAEKIIGITQQAGDRLHKINTRINRERVLYEGTSEIII